MRRQAAKRDAEAKNGWNKRAALWLREIKDETGVARTGAVGGNESGCPNAALVRLPSVGGRLQGNE
jgi:hypothetical protein